MAEPLLLGGYSAKSSALLASSNGMKCPGQERKDRLAGEIQSEKTNAVKMHKTKGKQKCKLLLWGFLSILADTESFTHDIY